MQNKNIVIGIGNLLFKDDGIGVIAVHFLKNNYEFTPELELLDGGTLGFNLAEYFLEYDNVFILDTISADSVIGTIYKIPSHKLLEVGTYKKTAHEVEVVQMLEACELYDKKAEVTIFGIIPQDIQTVKIGLSEKLFCKFDVYIQSILKSIEELNIQVKRINNSTLDDILKSLKGR